MKQFNILPEIKEKMLRAREGEITIILGEDTGTNLEVSLRHAESLRRSKRFDHVLYINLPFTKRRFTETAHENGTHVNDMTVKHFPTGNLYRPMNNMQDMFEKSPNTAIIINAWEYASSSYGCRESLIFKLMELTRGLGVTVIVYAMNKPESVTAGRINRTGLGKLAGITSEVIVLEEVDGSAGSQPADIFVIPSECEESPRAWCECSVLTSGDSSLRFASFGMTKMSAG
jgi:hypothetical protein